MREACRQHNNKPTAKRTDLHTEVPGGLIRRLIMVLKERVFLPLDVYFEAQAEEKEGRH